VEAMGVDDSDGPGAGGVREGPRNRSHPSPAGADSALGWAGKRPGRPAQRIPMAAQCPPFGRTTASAG
jgi:hypothetical protein